MTAVGSPSTAHGDKDTNGTAISLAIAGLILGLAGLAAGVLAYRRAGRAG
ncbi:MAG TPA: hypothetical protein VL738_00610 [Dactylosporangium sp.]|jgi:hypothetical protein|nr:hypothetical protein [Dactylosporangium sp.]